MYKTKHACVCPCLCDVRFSGVRFFGVEMCEMDERKSARIRIRQTTAAFDVLCALCGVWCIPVCTCVHATFL